MHGVAGGHGLAAGERTEAQRGACGVAGHHVDARGRHAQHVADQLGQQGFDALALRARPGGDDDPAGGADPQTRALERTAAGAFDVVRKTEAEMAPGRARRRLPGRKICPAARPTFKT